MGTSTAARALLHRSRGRRWRKWSYRQADPQAVDMGFQPIGAEFTVVFLVTLGLPVLMIQAIMLVTTALQ